MKVAQFQSIAEIVDVPSEEFNHPLLTMAKFVFADDQGNSNRQGIKAEDFDEVIKTAINTPVKMNFLGANVAGHGGAIPIGHITKMEKETSDGVNRLMAWAVLYKDEFPTEINFLKEAHAAGNAPGISYEIKYSDPLIENGIEWLKNMTTKAATFVKSPAYGKRTALLALAANQSQLTDDELAKELAAIMNPKQDKNKGGSQKMELEEKIKQLEAQAAAKQSELDAANAKIADLTAANEALTTENSGLKRTALVTARVQKYVEAGFQLEADAEKAAKKKDFFVSLSDEAFEEYLSDLKAVKAPVTPAAPAATAQASARGIPRLALAGDKEFSLDDLKASVRGITRGLDSE